MLKETDSIFG
jgi:hypothetical protein